MLLSEDTQHCNLSFYLFYQTTHKKYSQEIQEILKRNTRNTSNKKYVSQEIRLTRNTSHRFICSFQTFVWRHICWIYVLVAFPINNFTHTHTPVYTHTHVYIYTIVFVYFTLWHILVYMSYSENIPSRLCFIHWW